MGSKRQQRRLQRQLRPEAKYYAKVIQTRLGSLGFDHIVRKTERKAGRVERTTKRRQVVHFERVYSSETRHYLRIDATRLPHRVRIDDLRDETILFELSLACRRPVEFEHRLESGAWYIVNRDRSYQGIPNIFHFNQVVKNFPEKYPPLAFCVGIAQNQQLIYRNLAQSPHLLIAGATGTGKSTELNGILVQIMLRNGPDRLRLLLIDLKGGVELAAFAHAPHLLRPIVVEPEDVPDAFGYFLSEMKKRQDTFKGKVNDISDWNKKHPRDQLPYWVMVIDELNQILQHPDRKIKKRGEAMLGSILAIARATGGHVILCTQTPRSEVISGFIKANVPTRIAFSTSTKPESRTIIDVGIAAGLSPAGRGVLKYSDKLIFFQGPFLRHERVPGIVDRIRRQYTGQVIREAFSNQEILEYSINVLGGALTYRALWSHFKGRLTQAELKRTLQGWDNQVLTIKDQQYKVVPGHGGRGRKLELIETVEQAAD